MLHPLQAQPEVALGLQQRQPTRGLLSAYNQLTTTKEPAPTYKTTTTAQNG